MLRGFRAGWILAALLLTAASTVAVFRFIVVVRTELGDFLPVGETPAARLMMEELRSGQANSIILLGLEGGSANELARVSREMATALTHSGLFEFVQNGQGGLSGPDIDFLFRYRYLLAPGLSPASLAAPALKDDLERLLQGLQSSASPLVQRYGLADPPGALASIARLWSASSTVESRLGVWFASGRDRALILAKTKGSGMDVAAQDQVAGALQAAFAGAKPGPVRLLAAGPAVFARDAAHAIRSDVELLSVVSALLIGALLLWRFRSIWVVAVIAVPITAGVATAALAVQLAFGFIHGIAIGFGMTMLGVTADYPVLLIGHRKRGERTEGTIKRIGATFALAVVSAALGLTGMLFSGFPGLTQLGLFSVTGVLVAAAVTRWILPILIVRTDLAPVSAGDPARFLRIERLRRYRHWGWLPVVAAVIALLWRPPHWETDLKALSPVPKPALALDAELRSELGVPDVGQLVVIEGDSSEAVLQKEESLLPRIDALQASRVIAGAELAARYLPSAATQKQRQAMLPEAAVLSERLDQAREGGPFRPDAFKPFIDDVAASRTLAPLTPETITSPLLRTRIAASLFARNGRWYGLVTPLRLSNPAVFAQALADVPGATVVDTGAETNGIVLGYTRQALRWLAYGGGAALLALGLGLRSVRRLGLVLGAIGAALLATLAILSLAHIRLSLIHLVSLEFVTGVGLDYALFFARRGLDQEERARTLRTLLTCNAMTLLTFGLLAFCRTPVLSEIGVTVAAGALAAMTFSFLFAGERLDSEAESGLSEAVES